MGVLSCSQAHGLGRGADARKVRVYQLPPVAGAHAYPFPACYDIELLRIAKKKLKNTIHNFGAVNNFLFFLDSRLSPELPMAHIRASQ